jgi:hypothetical protein
MIWVNPVRFLSVDLGRACGRGAVGGEGGDGGRLRGAGASRAPTHRRHMCARAHLPRRDLTVVVNIGLVRDRGVRKGRLPGVPSAVMLKAGQAWPARAAAGKPYSFSEPMEVGAKHYVRSTND